MIPPISPAILAANPQFATIHDHLTKHILSPDASSKALESEHGPIQERLHEHHIQAAKEELLKQSLHDLVGSEALPPDLRELVLVIATYLFEAPRMNLSDEAHSLLAPEIAAFQSSLRTITPLLSTHLQHQHSTLLTIALATTDTDQPPPPPPPQPTDLPAAISHALTTLTQSRTSTLPLLTTTLINTLSTHLSTHLAILTSQIRHLELHTHGTSARHTAARATHLCTVAAGLEAKLRVTLAQSMLTVYSPDVQRALGNYGKHLGEVRGRMEGRERDLEEVLAEYDGVVGMGECARRYERVVEEVGRVKEEIERLEWSRDGGGGRASVRR